MNCLIENNNIFKLEYGQKECIGVTASAYKELENDLIIALEKAENYKQLSTLDNIGLNTAEKIIKGRPYKDIGDIYERGYIGHKTFLNIKEKIKVED